MARYLGLPLHLLWGQELNVFYLYHQYLTQSLPMTCAYKYFMKGWLWFLWNFQIIWKCGWIYHNQGICSHQKSHSRGLCVYHHILPIMYGSKGVSEWFSIWSLVPTEMLTIFCKTCVISKTLFCQYFHGTTGEPYILSSVLIVKCREIDLFAFVSLHL